MRVVGVSACALVALSLLAPAAHAVVSTGAYGNTATAPVFIQSFEVSNLQYLRTKTQARLAQLVDATGLDVAGNIVLIPPRDKPSMKTLFRST